MMRPAYKAHGSKVSQALGHPRAESCEELTYRLADREKRAIAYRESWLTPTLLDHLLLGLLNAAELL